MTQPSDRQAEFGPPQPVSKVMERFSRDSREFLAGDRGSVRCSVEPEQDVSWLVLEGWVDSTRTKSRLFSLVPKINGASWIVDRLRVGKPR